MILALALLTGWGAGPLRGQGLRLEVDLNASRLQYDTVPPLTAPSAAAAVEWLGRTLLARAAGSVTAFEGGTESFQGRTDLVGWFSPAGSASPLRLEVAGAAGGTTTSAGFDAFSFQGEVRLHVQGRRAGAWAGFSAGSSRNSLDEGSVGNRTPDLGGWVQVGTARFLSRYVDNRVDGDRYPELNLSALVSRGPVDVTAYLGWRDSPVAGQDAVTWGGASGGVWLRRDLALVLSAGSYAPDLLQGLPGGDFLSVGIRFTPQRRRTLVPEAPLPLVFSRDGGDAVAFRVPDAGTVAVAGDWTGWEPVPLSRDANGRWRLPADLEPGVYRFNLLVDGTRWVVPEGVPSEDDGFGGTVGLLVISEN